MEKKIIYQSKGINKKVYVKWCMLAGLILIVGILACIQKETFLASKPSTKEGVVAELFYESEYVLADKEQLKIALIIILISIVLAMIIEVIHKMEIDLYEGYMEFTDCSMKGILKATFGVVSIKNMKKIQINCDDIIDVKSDIRLSRIDISTKNEKQYHIFCQHPEELKEKLEIQL